MAEELGRRAPGKRRRRAAPSGDARERDLLTAFREILASGRSLAEISISEVAARAGITRPGFYFYFASKEALLEAAVEKVLEEMHEADRSFVEAIGDPLEQVGTSLRGSARIWRENEALMRAFVQGAALSPQIATLLEEFIEAFVEPISARILAIRRARSDTISVARLRELTRTLLWATERNFYRAGAGAFSDRKWGRLLETLTTIWVEAILGSSARRP